MEAAQTDDMDDDMVVHLNNVILLACDSCMCKITIQMPQACCAESLTMLQKQKYLGMACVFRDAQSALEFCAYHAPRRRWVCITGHRRDGYAL